MSSNNIVRNNQFNRNAMAGIEVHGRNNLIEGNEIWGTIQYHPNWASPPSWVDADGIHFFGAGHTIRNNYIHDITYSVPENVNPHIDCFQTQNNTDTEAGHDIVFEGNRCRNLETHAAMENGQGFMVRGCSNLIIRNNILQAFRIVNAWDCPGLTIVNNTFAGSLAFNQWWPGGVVLQNSPGALIKNSAFYNIPSGSIPYVEVKDAASQQGLSISNNAVFLSDGRWPGGSPWPNDQWNVDPRFVNPGANDFHLQATSPFIDAGATLSQVFNDIDGFARPQGRAHDISCLLYTSLLT